MSSIVQIWSAPLIWLLYKTSQSNVWDIPLEAASQFHCSWAKPLLGLFECLADLGQLEPDEQLQQEAPELTLMSLRWLFCVRTSAFMKMEYRLLCRAGLCIRAFSRSSGRAALGLSMIGSDTSMHDGSAQAPPANNVTMVFLSCCSDASCLRLIPPATTILFLL